MTTFQDLIIAPQEGLDRLIDRLAGLDHSISRLIGAGARLKPAFRKSSILGVAPTLPGLPILLMRRASCRNGLFGRACEGDNGGHAAHPGGDATFWTLLGPWSEELYDSALALPEPTKQLREVWRNDQSWEAFGVARPFSIVHGGLAATDFGKPGGGPQVVAKPEDVIMLKVRQRK
jgi:hypothetical protein